MILSKEIRPGIIENGICTPLITQVKSIFSEKKSISYAVSGGLIGIGTTLDPFFTASDRLKGPS